MPGCRGIAPGRPTASRSSPMKHASGGSSSMGADNSECPYCHVPLIRIQSQHKNTFGQWFVKCPYNVKGDPNTCGYIFPEAPYVKLEASEDRLKAKETSCVCCAEMKAELKELKKKIDSVVNEMKQPIREPKPYPKQIVIDHSVFIGFVGVLVGIVVACMWK